MRRYSATLFAIAAASVLASDHNNLEAGRPLRFDDAYSIAFGERAMEFGFTASALRRRPTAFGFKTELKYGFAKNQDVGIAIGPQWTASGGRAKADHLELSYMHGLRREMENAPAVGFKVEAGLPVGDAEGVDIRFRGILTKAVGQFDKAHLNLDLNMKTDPGPNMRRHTVDLVLGYSAPLGYPRRFDRTLTAELALLQSSANGGGYAGALGLGLRQQVDPQSVLDFGISAEAFRARGATRGPVRFTVGYSKSF